MNYRDAAHYRECIATGCANRVLPPRKKCNGCRVSKVYKVEALRPSRKGMNARGTALHRPEKSHTRKAKRQNPNVLGSSPDMVMTRWDHV